MFGLSVIKTEFLGKLFTSPLNEFGLFIKYILLIKSPELNLLFKNLSSTNEKANDQRSPKGLQESITS